ncbi:hypothetical protein ABIA31_000332 [Catenulispora sp. MAP5-51]
MPDSGARRRQVVDALVMLAAEATGQRAWVEKHGVAADELALIFDDAFRLVPVLVAEGHLDAGVFPDLQAIDEMFRAMSGRQNAGRWSVGALADDAGWIMVRETARRVLAVVG